MTKRLNWATTPEQRTNLAVFITMYIIAMLYGGVAGWQSPHSNYAGPITTNPNIPAAVQGPSGSSGGTVAAAPLPKGFTINIGFVSDNSPFTYGYRVMSDCHNPLAADERQKIDYGITAYDVPTP